MTIINANAMYPERNRCFAVRHMPDGTPCIIGSAYSHASTTEDSLFVFGSEGGRAKMHPLPEVGKCLYEIHPGDFVGVYEVDNKNELLLMYSFNISRITPEIAVGIPAQI